MARFTTASGSGSGTPGPQGPQGIQGEPGSAGPAGDPFGIYYLGNYNSESGYLPDIAVVRGSDGQLYLAKASGQLGDPVGNIAQWEVWIPKGQDGAPGTNGADALWNFLGEYNGGADYNIGDVVTYNGGTYYRILPLNAGYAPGTEYWTTVAAPGADGSQLNYWDGSEVPLDPAEDGFLILDGVVTGLGSDLLLSASDKIFITANNGEFINDPRVPSNQIATLGDIESIETISNGLVVTGQIDDTTINPAGTMSLSVQDGYTALMDLVASSGTFNGNVYITNLGNNKTTIIETPTTINDNLSVNGSLNVSTGATGTFVSQDNKTVTVTNGIITSIV